jgi:hypothetical protein
MLLPLLLTPPLLLMLPQLLLLLSLFIRGWGLKSVQSCLWTK